LIYDSKWELAGPPRKRDGEERTLKTEVNF
jgi:hypothetical protein